MLSHRFGKISFAVLLVLAIPVAVEAGPVRAQASFRAVLQQKSTAAPPPGAASMSPGPASPATSPMQTMAGGILRGQVKSGATPLPGVTITATNTLTGKRYTTVTDIRGVYAMRIPKYGRYVVRVELAAFAAETKEALLNASGR